MREQVSKCVYIILKVMRKPQHYHHHHESFFRSALNQYYICDLISDLSLVSGYVFLCYTVTLYTIRSIFIMFYYEMLRSSMCMPRVCFLYALTQVHNVRNLSTTCLSQNIPVFVNMG